MIQAAICNLDTDRLFVVYSMSQNLLGGSWVVISMVISPNVWVITIVTLLITPLITTHEPPSKPYTPWFELTLHPKPQTLNPKP